MRREESGHGSRWNTLIKVREQAQLICRNTCSSELCEEGKGNKMENRNKGKLCMRWEGIGLFHGLVDICEAKIR